MLAVPSHSPLTLGPRNLPRVFPSASASTPDTFILPRRQVLWPQLATQSGAWAWAGGTDRVFGGYLYNTTPGAGTLTFPNVNLFSGLVKLNILHRDSTGDGAVASVYWGSTDPGDKLGEIDMTSTNTQNNVQQIDLGTVTAGRGDLIIVVESGYFRSQQLELIQPTGSNLGTSIDDLPWFGDIPPICYSAASAAPSLAQTTTAMWGGRLYIDGMGSYLEYEGWLPQGSVTLSVTHYGHTFSTRAKVDLNGSEVGHLELYRGSAAYNYQTDLAINVPYTGVHTIRLTATNTGTAGESGTSMLPQWISWRKTAETGAITPTGTTYGVGSMELWPWFADDTNRTAFSINSNTLHYGAFYAVADGAPGRYGEWEVGVPPGTYLIDTVGTKSSNAGIVTATLDGGSSLGTVDRYSASTIFNQRNQISGVGLSPGALRLSTNTTSNTAYQMSDTLTRLVRTGD